LINWASIARPAFEAAFCTNLVVGCLLEAQPLERAGEAEAAASDGDRGAEINLDSVVELVGVDAVNLGDVEVAVGGEPVGDSI
jgi:hypothetical protein